jgi:hypothetical protein
MSFQGPRTEADQHHLLHRPVPFPKTLRLAHGNPRHAVHRKTIRAGADGRKRHGLPSYWHIIFNPDDSPRRSCRRRLFSSTVNFAAVPDTIDADNPDRIGDFVNHTIVAHADAPVVLAAYQLATTSRARVVAQRTNAVMTRS